MRKQDRYLTLRNNGYKELTLLNRERYIWLLFICLLVFDSFVTPWTVAHQAPLSMGFSRQEYWSGLPFPFLVVQTVKSLPATQESWVQSLGQEDPLEKGMAPHSSILVWRIPWTEEPGRL